MFHLGESPTVIAAAGSYVIRMKVTEHLLLSHVCSSADDILGYIAVSCSM